MADFKLQAIFEFINKGSRGVKQAEKDISGLERAANVAGQALKGALTVGAAKTAFELGKAGGEALRTESAFEAISGSAAGATERLEAMQRATRGALSEQEAMGAANQLMQMGLANTASELENTTEMAVRLGTAMGRDASQSIDEFAALLANQSIPRLDTFGISAGRVRARIAELQDATEGLSREQAFLQAVNEEGAKAMERLEGASDEVALSFERTEARIKDARVELSKKLAPAIADFLTLLNRGIEEGGRFTARLNQAGLAIELWAVKTLQGEEAAREYLEAIDNTLPGLEGLTEEVGHTEHNLRGYNEAVTNAKEPTDEVAEAAENAAEAMDGFAFSASEVAGEFGEMEWDNWREQAWKMAQNLDLNSAELTTLAKKLGIANSEQIQATVRAHNLTEALANGEITVGDFAAGMGTLAYEVDGVTRRSGDLEAGMGDLSSRLRDTKGDTDNLAGGARGLAGGLRDAESAARGLKGAIDRIPTEKRIRISIEREGAIGPGLQSGTRHAQAGNYIVGERGPELVSLPRGARVDPWSSPATRMVRNDNRRFSDTVIIQDRTAMAMYLQQKRQQQMAAAGGF